MKKCSKCGVEKNDSDFSKQKLSHDGLCAWCKPCSKEYYMAYCKNNKSKISKQAKAYRISNKIKLKEQQKIYRKKVRFISRKRSVWIVWCREIGG